MYRIYAVNPHTRKPDPRYHPITEGEWADTMDVFGGAPFSFALLAKPAQPPAQINGWYTALKMFEHVTPEVDRMLAFLKETANAGLSLQASPYWSA
jgi:hypothetical protein